MVYFSIRDEHGQAIADIDVVYSTIVPPYFHGQLQDVGVVGAVSTANHPVTDIPVFFVHPCQTAAALEEAASGRRISIPEYLPLWLGVIGISVGLHEPLPVKACKGKLNGDVSKAFDEVVPAE